MPCLNSNAPTNPARFASVFWLFAIALTAFSIPVQSASLDLPATVQPGALVIGRTEPDAEISVAGKRLRIAKDGSFLFGIGRDESGVIKIAAKFADGGNRIIDIPIQPRTYVTEHIDGVPESTVNPPAAIAKRIAQEQAEVSQARQRDDNRQDFRFGFIWPATGRISGVYGSQRILNGTPKNPHYGIDIAAKNGTPIKAPAGGIVSFAKPDLYLTGGTVIIDHGHGLSSVFVHMSRLDVKLGDYVEQGRIIGLVGATGRASGPHLHWGMNWFDVRLDPQLLMGPMP